MHQNCTIFNLLQFIESHFSTSKHANIFAFYLTVSVTLLKFKFKLTFYNYLDT